MMLDKKTTKEILKYEYAHSFNTIMDYEAKVWVSEESLIKYLNVELDDLHTRLSDKELPDVCQANLSGAIIWLESLKKALKR